MSSLFNQNLNFFHNQFSNSFEGKGLVSNIFESNLINIIIVLGILFYVFSKDLFASLSNRQLDILNEIQNRENFLQKTIFFRINAKREFRQVNELVKSMYSGYTSIIQEQRDKLNKQFRYNCVFDVSFSYDVTVARLELELIQEVKSNAIFVTSEFTRFLVKQHIYSLIARSICC